MAKDTIPKFCTKCGANISNEAKFCPKCGTKVEKEENEFLEEETVVKEQYKFINNGVKYHKDPIAAALLSFFLLCLGQFYNGQILKGLLFLIITIVLAFINGALSFLFILYATYDAYKNAKTINENNGNYFYNEDLKNREVV